MTQVDGEFLKKRKCLGVSTASMKMVCRLIICWAFVWLACSARATWYGDKLSDGADIFMVDLLYPEWPESTYYACWNMNTWPVGGYFYGGVACNTPDEASRESYRPGTVWSFWPSEDYKGRQVRNEYVNPEVYAEQYVGEGASGKAGSPHASWIKTKQWYTMLMRLWGTDQQKQECHVGWWMKDHKTGIWHHIASFLVPAAATGFKGNGGFMEDFGHGGRKQRGLWRGKGFARVQGKWEKCDTVTVDVHKDDGIWFPGWIVNVIENGSVVHMIYSCNRALGANLEPEKKYEFKIKQPDTPTLDAINASGKVRQSGRDVIVDWSLTEQSSPQLGYKIEVFDNPQCQGKPVLAVQELTPQVRTKVLRMPDSRKPYVRLTVYDVFDQSREFVLDAVQEEQAISADQRTVALETGLEYSYVEGDMAHGSLDSIDFNKPLRTGMSRGLDLSLRGLREGNFAFSWKGMLRVPETGAYSLQLKTCDGSRLKLGDKVVIDNDGLHSASDKRVSVFLEKGMIPLELSYFKKDANFEYTIAWLGWERPGHPMEMIPLDNLCCAKDSKTPTATLLRQERGHEHLLAVKMTSDRPDRVEYYNGNKLIAISDKTPFIAKTMLLDGKNELWARVFYQSNKTIDTPHLTVSAKSKLSDDWVLKTRGETGLAHAVTNNAEAFHFVGEGEYFVNKKVEGDFVLTAHIDSICSREINPGDWCWAGLMVRTQDDRAGYDKEFAIFHTVTGELRTSADFSDLGTGRMALTPGKQKNPWVRIVRSGPIFKALSSPDGKKWTLELERYVPQDKTMLAGMTFRTIPGKGKGIFSASISQVSITSIAARKLAPMRFPKCRGMLGYSLLAPNLAVARLRDRIVLMEKVGETWKQQPMKMPQGVKWVRSMAMAGDRILLLGVHATGGALFCSDNKGESWTLLNKDIAVNPNPDRALAGELISVDPFDPQTILVGSECKGLLLTKDGGKNWQQTGPQNESWTHLNHYALTKGHLMACSVDPDSRVGRVFYSSDAGQSWRRVCEVPGMAPLKCLFDVRGASQVYFFTQRGFYSSFTQGETLSRKCRDFPVDQPTIALDYFRKDRTTIFAVPLDGSGVYYTESEGLFWEKRAENQGWGAAYALDIDDKNLNHVTVFAEKGIYESSDGGKTWKQAFPET